MNTGTKNSERTQAVKYGSSIFPGLGLSFGFILGLLIDNLGMGLSLGLGIGGLANAIREHRLGEKGSEPAIAIWVLALAVVIGLWIWIG
jgi:hypothetical protein